MEASATRVRSGLIPAGGWNESFSSHLWNIKWAEFFPASLPQGVTVQWSTFDIVQKFAGEHFQNIYTSQSTSPFIWRDNSPARTRYYQATGDFFTFEHQDRIVGTFASNATDWSNYYLRNATFLSDFQGRGVYQAFLHQLIKILQDHGVTKLSGDVAPHNHRHIHILNKLGFNVTGVINSEQWGSNLHFERYLNPAYRQVFERQFCHGTFP